MKRMRFFWWMFAGPMAVLVAMLAVAFPWLAITERSGGNVLVVEGWLEEAQMKEAATLALKGNYRAVCTTGSIRPFAYYLERNRTIDIQLVRPTTGKVLFEASGLPGAGFALLADDDTLVDHDVQPAPATFRARITRPSAHLRFRAFMNGSVSPGESVLFVRYMTIEGVNVHLLQSITRSVPEAGQAKIASPTYAHKAAEDLIRLGLPEAMVQAVPSWGRPDSRTWANANYFAVYAKEHGIKAFDVATLGVHARRSRDLYSKACGEGYRVGVISIPDPRCPPGKWWRKASGWVFMLKELFGSSEVIAVDLTH